MSEALLLPNLPLTPVAPVAPAAGPVGSVQGATPAPETGAEQLLPARGFEFALLQATQLLAGRSALPQVGAPPAEAKPDANALLASLAPAQDLDSAIEPLDVAREPLVELPVDAFQPLDLDELATIEAPLPETTSAAKHTQPQELQTIQPPNLEPLSLRAAAGEALESLRETLLHDSGPRPAAAPNATNATNSDGQQIPPSSLNANSGGAGFSDDARRDDPSARFQSIALEASPARAPTPENVANAEAQARVEAGGSRETLESGRDSRALPELPARSEDAVVREVRMLAREGGGTARIRLDPPQLGELGLRVTVRDHVVSVSLIAEHGGVSELISRHVGELRHSMESQGLRIDRFDVGADSGGHPDDSRLDASERELNQQRRLDGGRGGAQASGFLSNGAPLPPRMDIHSLGAVDVRV